MLWNKWFIYLEDSYSNIQQLKEIVVVNGGHLDVASHTLDMIGRVKEAIDKNERYSGIIVNLSSMPESGIDALSVIG